MSYILEAIKKADQKRKLGSVPDVHSEHGSAFSDDRRARWPYWVAAALFINAGLVGWWLIPSDKESISVDTSEVASTVGPLEQSQQNEAAKATSSQGDKLEDQQSELVSAEVGVATTSTNQDIVTEPTGTIIDPKGLSPISLAEKELPAGLKETLPEVAAAAAAAASIPDDKKLDKNEVKRMSENIEEKSLAGPDHEETVDLLASGRTEGAIASLDTAEQEQIILGSLSGTETDVSVSVDDLVEEYKDEQEKEFEEKKLDKIPYYYQLPESAQQTLPEIHISFHSFSRRPSSRLVSINGKVLREGQALDKKTKLVQITPSGIVLLSANTWRFKVDVE